MKISLFYCLLLFILFGCNSKETINVKKFYEYINDSKLDEAKKMTTEDFKVEYLWEDNVADKKYFFERLSNGKASKPKIEIIKSNYSDKSVILKNNTYSVYNEYLTIPRHEYLTKVYIKENLIYRIQIDTLDGFSKRLQEISEGWSNFYTWFNFYHPSVNLDTINNDKGGLIPYLEDYYHDKGKPYKIEKLSN